MPDPTKDDAAAKAKADQEAKARADATKQPAAHDDPNLLTAAILKNLEQRTRTAGMATATEGLDETVPGGKYRVKGKLVNAHGREVDEDGKLLHPEEQRVNEFGQLV